jgi:hypothetical protein
MNEGKTLVLILCMHRCGSSVTANVLQRLGMSLGPFALVQANEHNKYGHFEATPIQTLDRDLLERVFGYAKDVPQSPEVLRAFCVDCILWHQMTSSCVVRLL